MNPAAPVWKKTSSAASYGDFHAPQTAQGTHMSLSGAVDLWPFLTSWHCLLSSCQGQQIGIMYLDSSCQNNMQTCHGALEKSLQLSELGHLEEGSAVFSVIYHRIVSTFKWENEYEGTFKITKCQLYSESKGIIIMVIKYRFPILSNVSFSISRSYFSRTQQILSIKAHKAHILIFLNRMTYSTTELCYWHMEIVTGKMKTKMKMSKAVS